MSKYNSYKDSGIEWIGEIPQDWNTKRLKDIIEILPKSNLQASDGEDEGVYPFYTSSQGTSKRINICQFKGDAISMATGGMASVNYIGEDFSTSTDCFNFHTKENTKFISYYLYSIKDTIIDNIWFLGAGMNHLQKDELLGTSLFFPIYEEQKAIADYLDVRVSIIDKRIELLKDKSEKYKTLRINLISHVVLQGLNTNVRLKDSGVERIGKIPENRGMKRMKDVCKLSPITLFNDIDEDDVISFVPMECLRIGNIEKRGEKYKNLKGSYTPFKENDILVSKVTPCFENGNIAIANDLINGKGLGSSEIFVFRCKSYLVKYGYYFFTSIYIKNQGCCSMKGVGGLKRITPDYINGIDVPLPPIDEQQKIVSYLDDKTSQIDHILETIDEEIEKLQELRKVLISNVITGKFKVI